MEQHDRHIKGLPEISLSRSNYLQAVAYAAVGAVGTLAHYVTLLVLVEAAGFNPVAGSIYGFIVGAFVNYLLNYRITFHSRKNHAPTMAKFFFVALIGLLINSAIMATMTKFTPMHYMVNQIIATGVVLITGFLANKYWTFGGQDATN